jgi:hypothetical protein
MAYENRKELYTKIEELRDRHLIVYITSSRPHASGVMASDVILELARQIAKIPKDEKEVDILIVSNGGDPTVSWRLVSMLRDRFKKFGALLPYSAYSAATLFALGADEIIMHPFSNLGPVDPQLSYRKKDNQTVQFGAEDLRHFLDYIKSEVGISDQIPLERSFELVCQDVGAIPIGIAKRSSSLALTMSEKLLGLHMKDQNKAKAIAEQLNTSFYHHGYPLGRKEAKDIGLNIIEPDDELAKTMWEIWLKMQEDMKCAEPFSPVEILFEDTDIKAALTKATLLNIPANIPPGILQNIAQNILSNLNIIDIPAKEFETFLATVESVYCRSEYKSNGIISANRKADLNIAINVLNVVSKWYFTEV